MSVSAAGGSGSSGVVAPTSGEGQKLSVEAMIKKLSALQSLELDLIAFEIGGEILKHLGSTNKLKTMDGQKEEQVYGDMTDLMMRMQALDVKRNREEGKAHFLTRKQMDTFVMKMSYLIKPIIAQSLGIVGNFLDEGMKLELSEYEPRGILAEIAKDMEITIGPSDVHNHYQVCLTVDRDKTSEEAGLVFSLKHSSHDREFASSSISLKELIAENDALVAAMSNEFEGF